MEYSEEVMDNFKNPRNLGEIENADAIGKIGNPACGDIIWVYIKVGKNEAGEEILEDVKFKTFGCTAAIASSSMLTQLAKGKTLEQAKEVDKMDIAESLKGLPPVKMHCSSMASKALKKAIEEYTENKIQNKLQGGKI